MKTQYGLTETGVDDAISQIQEVRIATVFAINEFELVFAVVT